MINSSRILAILTIILLPKIFSYASYQKIFYIFLYYHTALGFLRGFEATITKITWQKFLQNLSIFLAVMILGNNFALEYLYLLFLGHFVWSEVYVGKQNSSVHLLSMISGCFYVVMLQDYPVLSLIPIWILWLLIVGTFFYSLVHKKKEEIFYHLMMLVLASNVIVYAQDSFVDTSFYHILFWFFYSLSKSLTQKNRWFKEFFYTLFFLSLFVAFDYLGQRFFSFSPLERGYKVCALFHIVSSLFTSTLQPQRINALIGRI